MRQTYANEIRISSREELLEEIQKSQALGMSITGGEPLMPSNLPRTLNYLKFVKAAMGQSFHVHLYTNGVNFSEEVAESLASAGLDEIRFHPPKDRWNKVKKAVGKGMDVGAEVPLIPEKRYLQGIQDLILYLDGINADFINLNEFEYCFPNSQFLKERGFSLKRGTIA